MKTIRTIVTFVTVFGLATASVPNVMVFYETLCPYSILLMKTEIPDVVKTFGRDVFISLVPYGNAKTNISADGKLSVKCQHGPQECVGNLWHACTQLYMTPQERVNYAMCTMGQNRSTVISSLKTCTTADVAANLETCATGPLGETLIKLLADITDLAGVVWDSDTRHIQGVPTVYIDTFPISNDDNEKYSLVENICRMAKQKPKQCSN